MIKSKKKELSQKYKKIIDLEERHNHSLCRAAEIGQGQIVQGIPRSPGPHNIQYFKVWGASESKPEAVLQS